MVIPAALFNRMAGAGMIDDFDRVELWDGVIVEKRPKDPPRVICQAKVGRASHRVVRPLNAHDDRARDLIGSHGLGRQMRTLDALQQAVALHVHQATPLDHFDCAGRRPCRRRPRRAGRPQSRAALSPRTVSQILPSPRRGEHRPSDRSKRRDAYPRGGRSSRGLRDLGVGAHRALADHADCADLGPAPDRRIETIGNEPGVLGVVGRRPDPPFGPSAPIIGGRLRPADRTGESRSPCPGSRGSLAEDKTGSRRPSSRGAGEGRRPSQGHVPSRPMLV